MALIKQPINVSKVIVPDGYKLVKLDDYKSKLKVELDKLKVEKPDAPPSDEELIELGKQLHPYYYLQEQIDEMERQLNG